MMAPLESLDPHGIRGLLFDLDDTVTTDGKLTAAAYEAMERLHAAGRIVVVVTGRPAGWCDHLARMWPVDAVVGENGAFYFWHDAPRAKLERRYHDSPEVREANRARFSRIADRILREVPGAALSADQPYRETDLAIDYREDVLALSLESAERIAALMRESGMTAKVSSIHVNGWFGQYDKLGMALRMLRERFALEPEAAARTIAFVGDSPNDAPMFEFFARSIGVANVMQFRGRLGAAPRYVTRAESGAGFVEVVERLLAEG
jgi:HAD superfamily hydrolase (TIGR01484 family)